MSSDSSRCARALRVGHEGRGSKRGAGKRSACPRVKGHEAELRWESRVESEGDEIARRAARGKGDKDDFRWGDSVATDQLKNMWGYIPRAEITKSMSEIRFHSHRRMLAPAQRLRMERVRLSERAARRTKGTARKRVRSHLPTAKPAFQPYMRIYRLVTNAGGSDSMIYYMFFYVTYYIQI